MCLTSSMASPTPNRNPNPNPNPKLLNPDAKSFIPNETSPAQPKNEPVLPKKFICLPHELYQQPPPPPQPQLLPIPVVYHGFSYYPRYMCEPRQVWCPNPHVICYNTFEQPRPVIMPYVVGCGDEESGTKKVVVEEVNRDVEVSAGILGCGVKRKMRKGVGSVVGPRLMSSQRRDAVDSNEKCWVRKKGNSMNDGSVLTKKASGGCVVPCSATGHETILKGKTSLMIRNIPNQFRRQDMLRMLDRHCFVENRKAKSWSDPCRSAYDLLYLPMDFGYDSNLGYAFVNFTNAIGASRFCKFFHKYEWQVADNKKICIISWAKYQGKDELRNHFEGTKFACHIDGYLPVAFSPPRDGWRRTRPTVLGIRVQPTPPPVDQKIEMLKIRRRKARCGPSVSSLGKISL